MNSVSLLTIVSGRKNQLNNLLRGVSRQSRPPHEVVIVFMNEEPHDDLVDPGCPVHVHQIIDADHELPLAAARNLAASQATGDILAFLDVDCIPDPEYLARLEKGVSRTGGIVMGTIRYLDEGAADGEWTYDELRQKSRLHPRRPRVKEAGELPSLDYELFWSLAFGLRAVDFARLGGFDKEYTGYGGEDTDFGFTARRVRIPLFASAAVVYHQYHPVYSPPYNHLTDIVSNASRFHDKWQVWPMENWLKQFQRAGFIDWRSNDIVLLRPVDEQTLEGARSTDPFA